MNEEREVCRELCLELTSLCHQNCLHCSSDSTRSACSAEVLDLDFVMEALTWFAAQGGELLELSGGEPLLFPSIRAVVQEASKLGLRVRLYSTGLPEGAEAPSLSAMKEDGATEIVFSLHAAEATIHDMLTGTKGSFNRTIEAVREAVSLGLWTGVHFVPTRINADQMLSTVALAVELGVDEFAVLRFVPQGRGMSNRQMLELSRDEFEVVLESLAELVVSEKRIRIRAGCPVSFCSIYRPEIQPAPCRAGKNTALIDPTGSMYPCPAYKRIAGFEGQSPIVPISQMWEQPVWADLRASSYAQIGGLCSDCSLVQSCGGRCAAQRYLAHGTESVGPDPMCPLQPKSVHPDSPLVSVG